MFKQMKRVIILIASIMVLIIACTSVAMARTGIVAAVSGAGIAKVIIFGGVAAGAFVTVVTLKGED